MNVVGYVRLSRDEDKNNYSSVINQQDIISEYAKRKNWEISRMYIDDNKSGYTFDRPDFNILKEEVTNGEIDIIIAKDFSRIGRNQGESMMFVDWVERIGKRVILISESYDSISGDDTLGIKAWYNEYYIKDISRKIRSSMNIKQQNGSLIMSNFYGYKKIKIDEKFQLIIDENIRPVIELIFESYISGLGYKKICDILDEKGYPTPSEYIKLRFEKAKRSFENKVTIKWQTHMIQRIIKNDLYIGTLRPKKSGSITLKSKQIRIQSSAQLAFKNHHTGIISEEDFELANGINKKKIFNSNRPNRIKYDYIFSGFIRCGDCGFTLSGLNLRKSPVVVKGYNCVMFTKYGKKRCLNHSIKENKILFYFKEFLKDVKAEYETYISDVKKKENKNVMVTSLDALNREQTVVNNEYKLLITQKVKDLSNEKDNDARSIIETVYTDLIKEKMKRMIYLKEKISDLTKLTTIDVETSIKSNIVIFDSIINSEVPAKKDLERILEKVLVYEDRSLEFVLKVSIDKLTFADVV